MLLEHTHENTIRHKQVSQKHSGWASADARNGRLFQRWRSKLFKTLFFRDHRLRRPISIASDDRCHRYDTSRQVHECRHAAAKQRLPFQRQRVIRDEAQQEQDPGEDDEFLHRLTLVFCHPGKHTRRPDGWNEREQR